MQNINKEIKVKKYGIVHCMAQCHNCDWEDAIFSDKCQKPQDVRNETYKHIRKTGHSVNIETGFETKYYQ